MNVANQKLCEELYKLSEWDGRSFYHTKYGVLYLTQLPGNVSGDKDIGSPAYGLGYLLRKLPWSSWVGWNADIYKGKPEQFVARYNKDMVKGETWEAIADTPEDAACKLAIELLKQGVLKREVV